MLQESYVHIYSTIHKDWISLLASRNYYLCPPRMLKYDFRQGLALFGNFGPCFLASECPAWFCFHILSGSVLCAVVVGKLFSEEIFLVFRGNICCFQKKYCPPLLYICQISAFTPKSRRDVENIQKSSKDCYLGLWTMWTIGSRDENLNWKILSTLSFFGLSSWHHSFLTQEILFCGNVDQFHNLGQWVQILEF